MRYTDRRNKAFGILQVYYKNNIYLREGKTLYRLKLKNKSKYNNYLI